MKLHRKKGKSLRFLARRALWVVLGCLPMVSADAVELIVHRGVELQSISLANARAMFGLRLARWPDGKLVRVFVLPDSHPLHGRMSKERLDLYPYQLRQTWDRLIYSGMAQAPIEVASEEEMLAKVAATLGAIGYVNKARKNDPVSILQVE